MSLMIIRYDKEGRPVTQRIQVACIAGREPLFAAHAVLVMHAFGKLRGLIKRVEIERALMTAVVFVPADTRDVDAWVIEMRDALARDLKQLEWNFTRAGRRDPLPEPGA